MNPGATKEYKQLGDLYMQQNKTSSAISSYKKYLDKGSSDPEIAKIVAKNAYSTSNYQEAFKYYGMVRGDDSPEYHLEFGFLLHR